MFRLGAILGIAALGLAMIAPDRLLAQGRRMGGAHRPPPSARPARPAHELDQFEKMSPAQREEALARLPRNRAEKIRKQFETFDKLTPEQREKVREQLTMFRQLPPEKQQALRKAFDNFSKEPADRQQTMRDELNRLRALPPAEREAQIHQPEFRERFNKREQKILGEMSGLLPD